MKSLLGPRLRVLHWCADQAVTNALAQMDLTSAQGHIIGYLAHRQLPPCPKDIEEAYHLSHPTVSGLLSRLEKKGFIQIRTDEQDRRCKRVYLLQKGMECNQRIRGVIEETEARLTRDFGPGQREELVRLLDMAIENMGCGCCLQGPQEDGKHD